MLKKKINENLATNIEWNMAIDLKILFNNKI